MHVHRSRRRFFSLALILLLLIAGSASALAAPLKPGWTATPLTPSDQTTIATVKTSAAQPQISLRAAGPLSVSRKLTSVIVKLKVDSLASYRGGVPGIAATSPSVTGAAKLDAKSANSKKYLAYVNAQQDAFAASAKQSIPGATVTHKFDVVVGGVSMLVPSDQLASLSKLPGVQAVYLDQILHLDTDRSPAFIGAPTVWNSLGGQESAGDNVIVGVLDTGIWPEHPSFTDPDPSGKPYGPPPAKWKGTACDFGAPNPTNGDPAFTCNNKLLGAARFMDTYESAIPLEDGEFRSARDDDGHGTHTSSTAAGNAGVAATIFGIPRGIISGIAPRARISAYKVCGAQGCFGSDSAAAVQQAIDDGVDVINFSISGGSSPFADPVELAFLDAYNAGVFVAASAGNSGPAADTTDHRGPWVTTVGASTADRAFTNIVTLSGGGNTLSLKGTSLTAGVGPAPVVNAADAPFSDPQCLDSTPDGAFAGKIVICTRGTNGRVEKGFNVKQRGAVGMILYNQDATVTDQETDNHFLPATHLQFNQGTQVVDFLKANPGATATLTAGVTDTQQGDVMASFSSRGGPDQSLGVSKPDITAPGVQILAGNSGASIDIATGPQGELFQAIAGTSMSSPHIAGSGALIKALHPDWTAGQIKSALMTTAKTKGVVKEDGTTKADAFDDGSGRVDLNNAGDPGLTFDVTTAEYLAHPDDLWAVNYPSVYFPVMPGVTTVQRTAHSVLSRRSDWEIEVKAPKDVTISVPEKLVVPAGGDATFSITVDARDVPLGETRFATLILRQDGGPAKGDRVLHMPITFVRKQPAVALVKSCDPVDVRRGDTTTCTITASNTAFTAADVSIVDNLPKQLELVKGSVDGGVEGKDQVSFTGTLPAAEAPIVTVVDGTHTTPAGFLPLSLFGVTPLDGVGDETITNFDVPDFVYAGLTYTQIAVDSNGYIVIGGGTGADNDCCNNQHLPDPNRPNNIVAPFWSDLNPGAGGSVSIAVLTDGVDSWIVVEYNDVPEFSSAASTHSFQIWIGINGTEDVSVAYGPSTGTGDGGLATVGAENFVGNSGTTVYFNGTGTLPVEGAVLRVVGTPGTVGSRSITFQANGKHAGAYVNYAELNSESIFGTNVARFSGTVTR